jgi:hypothetical protein
MADNTIALQLQSPQLESPLNRMARGMQLLSLKSENDAAQRLASQNRMLDQAYAGSIDPTTGQLDINKASGILAAGGAGAAIPAMQSAYAASIGAKTKAQQAALDLVKSNADYAIQHMSVAKTPEEAKTIITSMTSDGRLDPSTAQMFISRLPATEADMPAFTRDVLFHALSAEKQLETHFTDQNTGGAQRILATPAYGGGPSVVVPGSAVANTVSPNDIYNQGNENSRAVYAAKTAAINAGVDVNRLPSAPGASSGAGAPGNAFAPPAGAPVNALAAPAPAPANAPAVPATTPSNVPATGANNKLEAERLDKLAGQQPQPRVREWAQPAPLRRRVPVSCSSWARARPKSCRRRCDRPLGCRLGPRREAHH